MKDMEVKMKHPIFEKVKKTSNADYEYFKQLFADASNFILNSIKLVKIPKGKQFITAEDEMDRILILLSGKVKAIEEHLSGDIYVFSRFESPEIFGEMEMFAGFKNFRASLVTETASVLVELPVDTFSKLLKNNQDLFIKRVEVVVKRSNNDERDNRFYLRLKAIDRIKLFFRYAYEQNQVDDLCTLRITRQEMADETGYSVKTVNRVVKELSEADLIKIIGQRIQINKKQYLRILDDLEHINETLSK